MRSDRDLLARLRALLRERAGVSGDVADIIEAELRQEFGGREVYVHRRRKAELLAKIAAAPDAEPRDQATALGITERHVFNLRALLRR